MKRLEKKMWKKFQEYVIVVEKLWKKLGGKIVETIFKNLTKMWKKFQINCENIFELEIFQQSF